MGTGGTNVVHLPCVPVVDQDGVEVMLSLAQTLRQAHVLRGLGSALLPVEREALLRLLESLTAAVLHGQDPQDVAEDRQLAQDLVDTFLEEHLGLFDLADPQRPLLQEWHVPAPDPVDLGRYQPLDQLHLRTPGGSSATWGATTEPREAQDPAVLFLLLTVSWFHGKPSNGAGASWYRPTSGDKRGCISGAPSGGPVDTVFHLLGDTLAETLLLNIPQGWLTSSALPAWLDQDHAPGPSQYATPGTLWRATWTPNRAHVRWQEGRPSGFTRGLTKQVIPEVADTTGARSETDRWKLNAKAVCTADYCRATRPDPTKPEVVHRIHATAGLHSAEGFERWYRDDLGQHLHTWLTARDTVLPPEDATRIGFHHEEGDTYGNRELSTWVELPLHELTLTGTGRQQAQLVSAHVSVITRAVKTAWGTGFAGRNVPAQVRTQVYAALDAPVLSAMSRLAAEEPLDLDATRHEMSAAARAAFHSATQTWQTAATLAEVSIARARFVRATQVKELV